MVEFDESGVRKDRTEDWKQCLVVNLQETEPMVADMVQDPDWGEYWDLCLENTLLAQDWSKESYHVEENNCFTFGPSGVSALPLAAGINEGGHYFRYFPLVLVVTAVVQNPRRGCLT